MKKLSIIFAVVAFAAIALSSCYSSHPCPAYRSVSQVEMPTAEHHS